jgi:hypothetical protein
MVGNKVADVTKAEGYEGTQQLIKGGNRGAVAV